MKNIKSADWTMIIKPKRPWFDINLAELWHHRDLIMLFVRRDFVAVYKQTILGPLWFFIQPLFTAIVFTIVFGRIAKIPTDGIPDLLFYLCGTVAWGYFASCLNATSNTFVNNAAIFGKVYFPRLVVPISVVLTNVLQFSIQFILFISFLLYFLFKGAPVTPNLWILATPVILLQMAILSLGTGITVSSLTTRYRDLSFLMGFAVQLWMYATPIVYPLSQIPDKYRLFFMLNPMSAVVEGFRFAFLGAGTIRPLEFALSWLITICIFFVGLMLFSRIEKTFMDTV